MNQSQYQRWLGVLALALFAFAEIASARSWGEWGEFGPCSRSCGTGTRTRRRYCLSHGNNDAASCGDLNDDVEAEKCNEFKCPIGSCGGVITEKEGKIQSPNYPDNYPENQNCTWVIRAPEHYIITLDFPAFQLEDSVDCNHDYVKITGIRDSNRKKCATQMETSNMDSLSNEVSINFKTDSMFQDIGFEIEFTTKVKAECDEGFCLNGGKCSGINECRCKGEFMGFRCAYRGFHLGPIPAASGATFPHRKSCSQFGEYFDTFDHYTFRFVGNCRYVMAASNDQSSSVSFTVLLQYYDECPRNTKTCVKMITVEFASAPIVTIAPSLEVTFGDQSVATPHSQYGVEVTNSTWNLHVHFADIKIVIDKQWFTVHLTADQGWSNALNGLCGNMNGEELDDVQDWGLVWKRDGDGCNTAPMPDPYTCSSDKNQLITHVCAVVFTSPFRSCNELVDTFYIYQQCVEAVCKCDMQNRENCHCGVVSAYARKCARADIAVGDWRTPTSCARECPSGQKYRECSTTCPATCRRPGNGYCDHSECVEGCHCPPDTFWNERSCVQKAECPCQHAGEMYNPGDVQEDTCFKRVCNGLEWNVTHLDCPAVATASGFGHFRTLDGSPFNFPGSNCSYLFAREKKVSNFYVWVTMAKCGKQTKYSCIRNVIVAHSFQGSTVFLTLKQNNEIYTMEDRVQVKPPTQRGGISVKQLSSLYLEAVIGNTGVHVLWNGNTLRLSVPRSFQGKVEGLAGEFNGKSSDDFKDRSGVVQEQPINFANSWGYKCDDIDPTKEEENACLFHQGAMTRATTSCFILKGKIFEQCRKIVDHQKYYDDCLKDSCACKTGSECFCAAVAAYAQACLAAGVVVNWRSQDCELSCPASQVFMANTSFCGRTCRSITETAACDGSVLVEGCACPEGLFLSRDEKCVTQENCPCYVNDEWREAESQWVSRRGHNCVCKSGKAVCSRSDGKGVAEIVCPEGQLLKNCSDGNTGSRCAPDCGYLGQPCPPGSCIPGCVCPTGLVKFGTKCVKEEECPCTHRNNTYNVGEKVEEGCKILTCVKEQKWSVNDVYCHHQCSMYNGNSFRTFDGKPFNFRGTCEYLLASDSEDYLYRITVKSRDCQGTDNAVCDTSVHIIFGFQEVTLSKTTNGDTTAIPARKSKYEYHTLMSVNDIAGFRLAALLYDSKVIGRVIWDMRSTVYVRFEKEMPEGFKSKLGLCGILDGDQSNDLTTSNNDLTTSEIVFGNSWKNTDQCMDVEKPEPVACKSLEMAEEKCHIIYEDAFKECRKKVIPHYFYKKCVRETCSCDTGGDCKCFCDTVNEYAVECGRYGIAVGWRSAGICPMMCEAFNTQASECTWKYNPCAQCTKYCCVKPEMCVKSCIGGCEPECDDGYLYDTKKKKCVPSYQCECELDKTPRPECSNKDETLVCGLTEWQNLNPPSVVNSFEIESVSKAKDKLGKECPDYVGGTECRRVKYPEAGLQSNVTCDDVNGLICPNSLARPCDDYEIRFNCCRCLGPECNKSKCDPEPTCKPNEELKEETGDCCSTYRCECIGCYYNKEIKLPDDTWTDNCTIFTCVSDGKGCYNITTRSVSCFDETCPDYATLTIVPGQYREDGCCPHKECICKSGYDPKEAANLTCDRPAYKQVVTYTDNATITCESAKCVCPGDEEMQKHCMNRTKCPAAGCSSSDIKSCGCTTSSKCVCNPDDCPLNTTSCGKCKTPVTIPAGEAGENDTRCDDNTCCPRTRCDPVTCDDDNTTCPDYKDKIESTSEDGCCPAFNCSCNDRKCLELAPSCNVTHKLVTDNVTKINDCCLKYTCECVRCEDEFGNPREIGVTWTRADDFCMELKCVAAPPCPSVSERNLRDNCYNPTCSAQEESIVDVAKSSDCCNSTCCVRKCYDIMGYHTDGETWTVGRCKKKKCVCDSCDKDCHIETIPPKCENQIKPTCVNGMTRRKVFNPKDPCCPNYECQCVCQAFGDPHYKTFDGTFYAFMGQCFYTLVKYRDSDKLHIYSENTVCAHQNNNPLTCIKKVFVKWENTLVELYREDNARIEDSVWVNGVRQGQLPYHGGGIIISISAGKVNLEIPHINLWMTFNGNKHPSTMIVIDRNSHFNRTVGLCGTCTNKREDDKEIRNGSVVINTDDFAYDWEVNKTNEECPPCEACKTCEELQKEGKPLPRRCLNETCPAGVCDVFQTAEAQKCKHVDDADEYAKACVFDANKTKQCSVCNSSAMWAFADLCLLNGVCVDWHNLTNCPAPECTAEGTEFRTCAPVCMTDRTCQNYRTAEDTCNKPDLTTSCVCKEGYVRRHEGSSECVKTECCACQEKPTCQSWQRLHENPSDSQCCKNWTCVCDACEIHGGRFIKVNEEEEISVNNCTRKVRCTNKTATEEVDSCFMLETLYDLHDECEDMQSFEAKCRVGEYARKTATEECCAKYECECDNSTAEDKPKCGPGEELETFPPNSTHCNPSYKCLCGSDMKKQMEECPEYNQTKSRCTDLEMEVVVNKTAGMDPVHPCCPIFTCQCKKCETEELSCQKDYEAVLVNSTECCDHHECKCINVTTCSYPGQQKQEFEEDSRICSRCVCANNSDVYRDVCNNFQMEDFFCKDKRRMKVVEKVPFNPTKENPCCPEYECVCKNCSEIPITECGVGFETNSTESECGCQEVNCICQSCKHGNKTVSVGTTWQERSERCNYTYTCTNRRNSSDPDKCFEVERVGPICEEKRCPKCMEINMTKDREVHTELCCSEYECVPQKCQMSMEMFKEQFCKRQGEIVIDSEPEKCCGTYTCECDNSTAEDKPKCGPGEKLETFPPNSTHCNPSYKCLCGSDMKKQMEECPEYNQTKSRCTDLEMEVVVNKTAGMDPVHPCCPIFTCQCKKCETEELSCQQDYEAVLVNSTECCDHHECKCINVTTCSYPGQQKQEFEEDSRICSRCVCANNSDVYRDVCNNFQMEDFFCKDKRRMKVVEKVPFNPTKENPCCPEYECVCKNCSEIPITECGVGFETNSTESECGCQEVNCICQSCKHGNKTVSVGTTWQERSERCNYTYTCTNRKNSSDPDKCFEVERVGPICEEKRCPKCMEINMTKDREVHTELCCSEYECVPQKCQMSMEMFKEQFCKRQGEIVRDSEPEKCCGTYTCECDNSTAEDKPKCGPGEELETFPPNSTHCNPSYKCLCGSDMKKQMEECPEYNQTKSRCTDLEMEVVVNKTAGMDPVHPCCPIFTCQCKKCETEELSCQQDYEAVLVNSTECCDHHECKCINVTTCSYPGQQKQEFEEDSRICSRCVCANNSDMYRDVCNNFQIEDFFCKDKRRMKVVEKVPFNPTKENPCCPEYECVCKNCSEIPITECGVGFETNSTESECGCQEVNCICQSCKHGNKTVSVGTTWQERSERCNYTYTCTNRRNSSDPDKCFEVERVGPICEEKRCPKCMEINMTKDREVHTELCCSEYECVPQKCQMSMEMFKEQFCKRQGEIVRDSEPEKCCGTYTCECDNSTAEDKPKCGPGEELETFPPNSTHCNPSYKCLCGSDMKKQMEECPEYNQTKSRCADPEMEVVVNKTAGMDPVHPCCPIFTCQCKKCETEELSCQQDYEAVLVNSTECCDHHECKCINVTTCSYPGQQKQEFEEDSRICSRCVCANNSDMYRDVCNNFQMEDFFCKDKRRMKVVEKVPFNPTKENPCCPEYECVCKNCSEIPITECGVGFETNSTESECGCQEVNCICQSCKHGNKTVSVGTTWQERSERCNYTYTCTNRRNSSDPDKCFEVERVGPICEEKRCPKCMEINMTKDREVHTELCCSEYECVRQKCPITMAMFKEQFCKRQGEIVIDSEPEKCCGTYTCKCDNSTAQDKPKCGPGEELETFPPNSTHCNPSYKCLCGSDMKKQMEECPEYNQTKSRCTDLEMEVVVNKTAGMDPVHPCCPIFTCQCKKCETEELSCQQDYEAVLVNSTECCDHHECKCINVTTCSYPGQQKQEFEEDSRICSRCVCANNSDVYRDVCNNFQIEDFFCKDKRRMKVVEKVPFNPTKENPCCPEYECVCKNCSEIPITECGVGFETNSTESECGCQEVNCICQSCKHGNKTVSVGTTWQERSERCNYTYTCMNRRNSSDPDKCFEVKRVGPICEEKRCPKCMEINMTKDREVHTELCCSEYECVPQKCQMSMEMFKEQFCKRQGEIVRDSEPEKCCGTYTCECDNSTAEDKPKCGPGEELETFPPNSTHCNPSYKCLCGSDMKKQMEECPEYNQTKSRCADPEMEVVVNKTAGMDPVHPCCPIFTCQCKKCETEELSCQQDYEAVLVNSTECCDHHECKCINVTTCSYPGQQKQEFEEDSRICSRCVCANNSDMYRDVCNNFQMEDFFCKDKRRMKVVEKVPFNPTKENPCCPEYECVCKNCSEIPITECGVGFETNSTESECGCQEVNCICQSCKHGNKTVSVGTTWQERSERCNYTYTCTNRRNSSDPDKCFEVERVGPICEEKRCPKCMEINMTKDREVHTELCCSEYECVRQKCPITMAMFKEQFCKRQGEIVIDSEPETCCGTYTCKCDNSTAQDKPKCGPGEELETFPPNSTHCNPSYKCLCGSDMKKQMEECPEYNQTKSRCTDLEMEVVVNKTAGMDSVHPCCPIFTCQCKKCETEELSCQKDYEAVLVNSTECCDHHECKCINVTTCSYPGQQKQEFEEDSRICSRCVCANNSDVYRDVCNNFQMEDFFCKDKRRMKVVEKVPFNPTKENPCCPEYECVCKNCSEIPITECGVGFETNSTESECGCQEVNCICQSCKHGNKTVSVGTTWQERSERCNYTYTCTNRRNSSDPDKCFEVERVGPICEEKRCPKCMEINMTKDREVHTELCCSEYECVPQKCQMSMEMFKEQFCKRQGEIVRDSEPEKCCGTYTCECDNSTAEDKPKCGPGEELETFPPNSTHCNPSYKCLCGSDMKKQMEECPEYNQTKSRCADPEMEVVVNKTAGMDPVHPCCPIFTCQCKKCETEELSCQQDYKAVLVNSTECCDHHECKCINVTTCSYPGQQKQEFEEDSRICSRCVCANNSDMYRDVCNNFQMEDFFCKDKRRMKVVEKVPFNPTKENPCCPEYECVCKNCSEIPITECGVGFETNSTESECGCQEVNCICQSCKHGNKTVSVGTTWQERSERCNYTYTCTNRRNSSDPDKCFEVERVGPICEEKRCPKCMEINMTKDREVHTELCCSEYECVRQKCPITMAMFKEQFCKRQGEIVIDSEPEKCCGTYTCKCDNSTAQDKPKCGPGEELETFPPNSTHCNPSYKCLCGSDMKKQMEECPEYNQTKSRCADPEMEVVVNKTAGMDPVHPCCPIFTCQCKKCETEELSCQQDYKAVLVNSTECCDHHECKCINVTTCSYPGQQKQEFEEDSRICSRCVCANNSDMYRDVCNNFQMEDFFCKDKRRMKVVEKVPFNPTKENPCCPEYECVCKNCSEIPITECGVGFETNSTESECGCQEVNCICQSCKHGNKTVSVGTTWQERSERCNYTYTCTNRRNSSDPDKCFEVERVGPICEEKRCPKCMEINMTKDREVHTELCCSEYECVRQKCPITMAMFKEQFCKRQGEIVIDSEPEKCCGTYTCKCDNSTAQDKPKCGPGEELETFPPNSTHCNPSYKCLCGSDMKKQMEECPEYNQTKSRCTDLEMEVVVNKTAGMDPVHPCCPIFTCQCKKCETEQLSCQQDYEAVLVNSTECCDHHECKCINVTTCSYPGQQKQEFEEDSRICSRCVCANNSDVYRDVCNNFQMEDFFCKDKRRMKVVEKVPFNPTKENPCCPEYECVCKNCSEIPITECGVGFETNSTESECGCQEVNCICQSCKHGNKTVSVGTTWQERSERCNYTYTCTNRRNSSDPDKCFEVERVGPICEEKRCPKCMEINMTKDREVHTELCCSEYECVPQKCQMSMEMFKEQFCKRQGEIVRDSEPEKCCGTYTCECDNSTAEDKPKCGPGEELETFPPNSTHCNPSYKCLCGSDMKKQMEECPEYNQTKSRCADLEMEVVVNKTAGMDPVHPCCPIFTCVCNVCMVNGTAREKGSTWKIYKNDGCNVTMECSSNQRVSTNISCYKAMVKHDPQDSCLSKDAYGQNYCSSYQKVEIIEDGKVHCCPRYRCVCLTGLQLGLLCSIYSKSPSRCAEHKVRQEIGTVKGTRGCCPETKCVCKNDTVLKNDCEQWDDFECGPGYRRSQLVARSNVTGPCCPEYKCECLPSVELKYLCPDWNHTCELGTKRVRTNNDAECCPTFECKCNKCVYKGNEYRINSTFPLDENCWKGECVYNETTGCPEMKKSRKTICPPFDYLGCLNRGGKVRKNGTTCCQYCENVTSACEVGYERKRLTVRIGTNVCFTGDKVDVAYCAGSCPTKHWVNETTGLMHGDCRCCLPARRANRTYDMMCDDGVSRPHLHPTVMSCSCSITPCEEP